MNNNIEKIDTDFKTRIRNGEMPQDLWNELYFNSSDSGSPFDQFMKKTNIDIKSIFREHFSIKQI